MKKEMKEDRNRKKKREKEREKRNRMRYYTCWIYNIKMSTYH